MTIVIPNEENLITTWSRYNGRNRRGIITEIMYDSSITPVYFRAQQQRIGRHSNGSCRESLLVPILQATGCKRIKQSITEFAEHESADFRSARLTSMSHLSRFIFYFSFSRQSRTAFLILIRYSAAVIKRKQDECEHVLLHFPGKKNPGKK